MKLSTRITHARIRLKHKFLRMRVQKPLYYQTLVAIMLVVGLGGIITVFLLYSSKPEVSSSTDAPQLTIKEYSINGKVTEITTDQITISATAVETQNGISTVVEITKLISITPATPVTRSVITGGQVQTQDARAADLATGDLVTVYTPTDPASTDLLPASRLEILK